MNPVTPEIAERWAIVGGGVMGLALARRLAQAGQQVTILEAAAEIGGLASAWQIGEVTWDKHYHVTLLSDLRLRRLLADLGLEKEMRWVETRTGFYTDGQLHSMSSTPEFLRFPPLGLIDKLRLGATIFAASRIKNWRPLENILVADWLRRWSSERTFRKIWEPLLLSKLGECYRRTAASFIWATIQRMYGARRSGLKKEMFGYLPGGYARFFARVAEDLEERGVDLRTSARASRVVPDPGGVRVEYSIYEGDEATSHAEVFDRVILTSPSPLIAQVVPDLTDEERGRHESIEYLGIVCASALLKRPLAGYYVTNITDGGFPFTAVIEMTALVDPAELGRRTLVYLPRYAASDDDAWKLTDAQIEEQFLAGLSRMYPDFRRDQVEAFRVSRARHVMALPTLGYSDRLPPLATAVPGVYAINSAHITAGTLNVNEVLTLADQAFEIVIQPVLGAAPLERPQPLEGPPA